MVSHPQNVGLNTPKVPLGLGAWRRWWPRLRAFLHPNASDGGLLAMLHNPDKAAQGRLIRRFASAIDNIDQGIVIFDRDRRLVVFNRRLADIYPTPEGPAAFGTPMAELVARHVAAGLHPGQSAEEILGWLDRKLRAGKPFSLQHATADGRVVRARWTPMDDEGWVGTYADVTEQQRSNARLAQLSRTDGVTGLANRAALAEAIGKALDRVRRGEPGALLVVDIDRFRRVSDHFGHATAEALLREVAARLLRAVREDDVLARLGSDDFAILQTGVAQPGGAETLARRLVEVLSAPFAIDGHEIIVGSSVGIALLDAADVDPEVPLRNATLALTIARREGRGSSRRGCWKFFAAAMDQEMRARHALEVDLRHAIERDEFELFYQPLINIDARRVSGFEALLRWRHPTRGLVPPDTFIPLAEETGLIVPIGEWVLRTACREAMGWRAADDGPALRVAVNLSAVQFASPGLVETVEEALSDSGLPGDRLELEITESVLLRDNEATLQTLHRLRALGARISMDDFGTGYSSLSYLRSFPFDKIKIDKSFIRGLPGSGESEAIVRAITGLGGWLGITTTAEGVETLAQLERLIDDGCTEVQGYFFSPPRPAADVPDLIRTAMAAQAA